MTGHPFPRASCAVAVLLICVLVVHAGAQDLQLALTPMMQDEAGPARQIGARIDAEDGLDSWDLPEPPAPPGGCPLIALVMPDSSGGLPNSWRHDYRNLDTLIEQESMTWELRLCSNSVPVDLTLAISEIEDYATDYQLWFHDTDGGTTRVPVPGELVVELNGLEKTIHLEVLVGGGMRTESTSWSALRSLFR